MTETTHPADHMRKHDGGNHYLTLEERKTLAEWLVRNGGEGFDWLDAYEEEFEAGIDVALTEADVIDLDLITDCDRTHVRRMVSGATVTVHLPDVPEPLSEGEIQDWADAVAQAETADGYVDVVRILSEEGTHISDIDRVVNEGLRKRQAKGVDA